MGKDRDTNMGNNAACMENVKKALGNLGLSEKEAAVYLAALTLGPSTILTLARHAAVNRATAYLAAEKLGSRGLLSTVTKDEKRLYVAETPELLRKFMEEEKRVLQEKEQHLHETFPMLFALFSMGDRKPQVRYLEGKEGLQTVREMFLRQGGDFVQIVPLDVVRRHPELHAQHEEHLASLSSLQVPHRALLVTHEPIDIGMTPLPSGLVRILPPERFPIEAEITVRGDTIFLYAFLPTILSVVITSRELAIAVKALFELAWEGASVFPAKRG